MDILQALGFVGIILFALGEGFTHAILYGRKGHNSFKWNEHLVFNIQRVIFIGAIFLQPHWIVLLAGIMCFPFFHNGMYYTQRDRIDGSYPERWWSMTKDSSAYFNFSVKERSAMALFGLAVFVFSILR